MTYIGISNIPTEEEINLQDNMNMSALKFDQTGFRYLKLVRH